jgi:hypothetical protein
MSSEEGFPVAYVDITPSWAGLMPALIAVLQHADSDNHKEVTGELMRLARHVDQLNDPHLHSLYNAAGQLREACQQAFDYLTTDQETGYAEGIYDDTTTELLEKLNSALEASQHKEVTSDNKAS